MRRRDTSAAEQPLPSLELPEHEGDGIKDVKRDQPGLLTRTRAHKTMSDTASL